MSKEINLIEEETGSHETPIPEPVQAIVIKNEEQEKFQVRRVIEALLFATPDPLPVKKIQKVLTSLGEFSNDQICHFMNQLSDEYDHQHRAFQIEEIADGYVLRSLPEFSEYLDILFNNKKVDKISPTATEVLAIVAYRQPITKPQIEELRGVDSSGVMANLVERGLIETAGKLDAPGKPTLYRTTDQFLKHYGLQSINDLPSHEGLKGE